MRLIFISLELRPEQLPTQKIVSWAAIKRRAACSACGHEGERRFTLEERDGRRLELTLHDHNRVIRSEGCTNEHEARDKAHGWLIALEVMRDE